MKNLQITGRVLDKNCEFRKHYDMVFWHGTPARMAQPEWDSFIRSANRNLGRMEFTSGAIMEALNALGIDNSKIELSTCKVINERHTKKRAALFVKNLASQLVNEGMTEDEAEAAAAAATMIEDEQPEQLEQPAAVVADGNEGNDNEAAQDEAEQPEAENERPTEFFHAEFDDMVADVRDGFSVYLYGPAGTGKSHTAKQIAEALGLEYYELTQLQFAHEIKGYGDAAGRYVETPAYKAVTRGGLLFLDEWDRSALEATTTINTLLANGRGDFPVIGNVQAHPNFRVVAAGNTTMQGADDEYTAAQQIDASSRDRFIFYKVDYDERVELSPSIANGDTELVKFMNGVRAAIATTHIKIVASYRATKYLKSRSDRDLVKVLQRGLLKGMEQDDIRMLVANIPAEAMATKWGRALRKLC